MAQPVDPHATTVATCPRGHVFEDLAVAVEQTGGWCPTCDAPARRPVMPPTRPKCPECGSFDVRVHENVIAHGELWDVTECVTCEHRAWSR